ncbi:hypothetical protein [Treponema sp. R6D11]
MGSIFNILDETTWQLASENDFVWKDNTCFNEENNKQINEKEMVAFLKQLIDIVDSSLKKSKTDDYGRDKIISFMLDSIFAKVVPEEIPSEAICLVELGIEPNLVHTVYQSMKKKNNSTKKFNVLEESTWKLATDNEFTWKGKKINGSQIKKSETICTEKLIVNFLGQIFNGFSSGDIKNKIEKIGKEKLTTFILDNLINNVSPGDCIGKSIDFINNSYENSIVPSQKSVANFNTQGNSTINVQYSPIVDDSKPGIFLFLGISSLIVCFYLFYKTANSIIGSSLNTEKMVTALLFPIISLIIASLFFNKYSKEKNKRKYYEICKSMEYWLGHKSDELIISWGTPSKTSKLPNDKSITIMEYKDSIRNYTGYSTRSYSRGFSYGIHSGQSRTTKYTKTFYVQNGYIIDYRYTIQ